MRVIILDYIYVKKWNGIPIVDGFGTCFLFLGQRKQKITRMTSIMIIVGSIMVKTLPAPLPVI
jgi:hypothetical protein